MNLWDAFKVGGLPGAAAQVGAGAGSTISKSTGDALFAGGNKISNPFAPSFTTKFLFFTAVTFIGIAAVRKAIK